MGRKNIASLWIAAFLFIINSSYLCAQQPSYNLLAKIIGDYKFYTNLVEFEIYLIRTDTTTLSYAGGEFVFNFSTAVANGGTLTYTIEGFGSTLPAYLRPFNPMIVNNNDSTSQLQLSMRRFPPPGFGYPIPVSATGIKIVTLRIETSAERLKVRVDSLARHFVDLKLKWRHTPSVPSTNIFSFINNLPTNITDTNWHMIDSSRLQVHPVELMSFNGSSFRNKITLNWTTANETNNSGFEIHRSSENTDQWSSIGFVNGNGTINEPWDYSFKDEADPGMYRYRLKQIDYNGNFEIFYLNETVTVDPPGKYSVLQNYPNPFNPSTNIDFEIPIDAIVILKVYDIQGRLVKVINKGMTAAGYHRLAIDLNNFTAGTYFYRFESGIFQKTGKLLLIK